MLLNQRIVISLGALLKELQMIGKTDSQWPHGILMNFVLFLNSRPADNRQALRAKQEGRPSLVSSCRSRVRVQQDGLARLKLSAT
jgi:hypothetical protein